MKGISAFGKYIFPFKPPLEIQIDHEWGFSSSTGWKSKAINTMKYSFYLMLYFCSNISCVFSPAGKGSVAIQADIWFSRRVPRRERRHWTVPTSRVLGEPLGGDTDFLLLYPSASCWSCPVGTVLINPWFISDPKKTEPLLTCPSIWRWYEATTV